MIAASSVAAPVDVAPVDVVENGGMTMKYMYEKCSAGKRAAAEISEKLPMTEAGSEARTCLATDMANFDKLQKSMMSFCGFQSGFQPRIDKVQAQVQSVGPKVTTEVHLKTMKRMLPKQVNALKGDIDATLAKAEAQVNSTGISGGSSEDKIEQYNKLLAMQEGRVVAEELVTGGKAITDARQKMDVAFKNVEDAMKKHGEANAKEVSADVEIDYSQRRAEGQVATAEWAAQHVKKSKEESIDAVKDADKQVKTSSFGLFGMTFAAWKTRDPAADAAAESYAEIHKTWVKDIAGAEASVEKAAQLLAQAKSKKKAATKDVEASQVVLKKVTKEYEAAANVVEEHEKALKKLAQKYPGMSPKAIIDLSDGIKMLVDIQNKTNLGEFFYEKAKHILKDFKGDVESLNDVVISETVEEFQDALMFADLKSGPQVLSLETALAPR